MSKIKRSDWLRAKIERVSDLSPWRVQQKAKIQTLIQASGGGSGLFRGPCYEHSGSNLVLASYSERAQKPGLG